MATKTPSKGKKAAAAPEKGKASAPKKSRAGKAPPVEAKEPDPPELDSEPRDDDEDDDDDDLEQPRPAAAAAAAKKPAPAGKPAVKGAPATGDDAPQVVPARRLTPEAKAKINELVSKGMPLQDALRAAAAWETFVAPVREEPAKLVQGRSFEGGGRPPARPKTEEDAEPEERDEEPVGSGGDDE